MQAVASPQALELVTVILSRFKTGPVTLFYLDCFDEVHLFHFSWLDIHLFSNIFDFRNFHHSLRYALIEAIKKIIKIVRRTKERPLVAPYTSVTVIAPSGQTSIHVSHPRHSSMFTGSDFPSTISKTCAGQAFTHSSSPLHLSLSTSTCHMRKPPTVNLNINNSLQFLREKHQKRLSFNLKNA